MSDKTSTLREALIVALTPHITMRCGDCAGTGVALTSNLDCTSCDATGTRPGYAPFAAEVADAAIKVLKCALLSDEAIERFEDGARDEGADIFGWHGDYTRGGLKAIVNILTGGEDD